MQEISRCIHRCVILLANQGLLTETGAAVAHAFTQLINPHRTPSLTPPPGLSQILMGHTKFICVDATVMADNTHFAFILASVRADKCLIELRAPRADKDSMGQLTTSYLRELASPRDSRLRRIDFTYDGLACIETGVLQGLLSSLLQCPTSALYVRTRYYQDFGKERISEAVKAAIENLPSPYTISESWSELHLDEFTASALIEWLAGTAGPVTNLKALLIDGMCFWTRESLLKAAEYVRRTATLTCLAVNLECLGLEGWGDEEVQEAQEEVHTPEGTEAARPWLGVEEGPVLEALIRDLLDTSVVERPATRFAAFDSDTVETLRVCIHPRQIFTAPQWLFSGLKARFPALKLLQLVLGGEVSAVALDDRSEPSKNASPVALRKLPENIWAGRVSLEYWERYALPRINPEGWRQQWQGSEPKGVRIEYWCGEHFELPFPRV